MKTINSTVSRLSPTNFPRISRGALKTLQMNLGYLCNLSCVHCHVNAGPKRREIMSRATMDEVLAFILRERIRSVDLTGGAPEMNPHFRYLVETLAGHRAQIIDRCNLTILERDGFTDLPEFLARHGVEITASLPCYLEENVDRQRGRGVFLSSIRVLKKLNRLGYGRPASGLVLNLVYNPQGATLPPPQDELREAYARHLQNAFGVVFNDLYTLANMPIERFGSRLISTGDFESYIDLLRASFRPGNLESVMCRTTLSVDWQGYVYDCDFNQMLSLSLGDRAHSGIHIRDIRAEELEGRPIHVADHCYGCTAGQGSSCTGALARKPATG